MSYDLPGPRLVPSIGVMDIEDCCSVFADEDVGDVDELFLRASKTLADVALSLHAERDGPVITVAVSDSIYIEYYHLISQYRYTIENGLEKKKKKKKLDLPS